MTKLVAAALAALLCVCALQARQPAHDDPPVPPTRVALLNFGPAAGPGTGRDIIGVHLTAALLRDAIPALEKEHADVVVLRVSSSGGDEQEARRIQDLLQREFQPRFRTVAWIDSALGEGLTSVWGLEEFYCLPQARFGACAGRLGNSSSADQLRAALRERVSWMEGVSNQGDHDPRIMLAMQTLEALSADTNPATGAVSWRSDEAGAVVVNGKNQVLILEAGQAVQLKVARAIAADKDELARALGLKDVQWVAQAAAEALDTAMRDAETDHRRAIMAMMGYRQLVGDAEETPDRVKRLELAAQARRALGDFQAITQRRPVLGPLLAGYANPDAAQEWFGQQDARVERLEGAGAVQGVPADGAARVAILNFGPSDEALKDVDDMVGVEITPKMFHEVIPLLEKDQVGVVVLRVKSSAGGYFGEIERIQDLFEKEYKPKFRMALWIEEAIGAGLMSVWGIREIYCFPDCKLGPCTGWSGSGMLTSMYDIPPLEEWLLRMNKISKEGGHDPKIMRSMQTLEPLSADVDPATGSVTWRQDDKGQTVLNPRGRALCLDAATAARFKVAQGIAADRAELVRAMGLQRVEWAGEEASAAIIRAIKEADTANKLAIELVVKYVRAVLGAQETHEPEKRAALVEASRELLSKMEAAVRENRTLEVALAAYVGRPLDREFFTTQRDLLRDLSNTKPAPAKTQPKPPVVQPPPPPPQAQLPTPKKKRRITP